MSLMQQMDPWNSESGESNCETALRFSDNFEVRNQEKLPDSDEYIALLERRLNRLKSGNNRKSTDVLEDFRRTRDDCLARFVAEDDVTGQVTGSVPLDDNDEATINVNSIERRLFPEKQALTQEELRRLVDCDVLSKINEDLQQQQSDETRSKTDSISSVEFNR